MSSQAENSGCKLGKCADEKKGLLCFAWSLPHPSFSLAAKGANRAAALPACGAPLPAPGRSGDALATHGHSRLRHLSLAGRSSRSSTTRPISLCQSLPNGWLYVKREVERAASDLCTDNRMISEARLRFSLCSQAKDFISPRLRVQISDSQLYGEAFNSPESTVLFLYVSLR